MKKVLALVLALVLVLSLVACGLFVKKSNKVYSIGDTANTDTTEVFVSNVELDKVNDLVIVIFSVKNIGKTALNSGISTIKGSSVFLQDIPYVDYNDGYEYDDKDSFGTHSYDTFLDLEPLGKAITITSNIKVPDEVITNTSAPLLVKLRVPNSSRTEEITYKVR